MDYKKLKNKYQSKYDQLADQLEQQAQLNDPQKMGQLSQEFADVKQILETIKKYIKTTQEIDSLKNTVQSEEDKEMQKMMQDEITQLQQQADQLKEEITQLIRPQDPRDKKNAIMEIRAGTGGDESTLFAADLFRMYTRYAENKGWQTEVLSSHRNEINGYKEIIFEIKGKQAYGRLKYESGVHRVQRVPATEKSGRIHTSAASVVVLPEAEEIDLKIDPSDLRVDTFCASGHGGQSVNTTYSAVRITHLPSGIVATCQDEKSQQQNKIKAMQVLRSRLLQKIEDEKRAQEDAKRKSQIGSGDRSEKIRTYNWPQDRVTDHRIKLTLHNLDNILDGELDQIIDELIKAEHAADKEIA